MKTHFWLGVGAAHEANKPKEAGRKRDRQSIIVATVIVVLAAATLTLVFASKLHF
jgi:hypothetical protein